MAKVKTRYDDSKRAAIITSPTYIIVAKSEYKAIQKVTDGQFGYFFITERIKLRKGSIISLDLSDLEVQISDLHPDLANLSSLETLNLNMNMLEEIPDVIGKLSNLKKLRLEHNNLIEFPDCIGNLKKLEELYVMHNQLTSLPRWIERLASLQTLYAGENKIKSLPQSMRKMKSLEYFVIRSNPLDNKTKALIKELKKSGVKII